ncbi:thioredoxin family protein [Trinickia caryophylli]|uniref:Peroxiredoxin n=1 Tax=Trinickia caryophylli TaxID=28094 RepID=A0A1X7HAU5_TRICW|nr:thioredoxin family protein [Trinickia caryophylli]PMS13655.1 thioredoxin family protein [Trinickia caryophylli]TRX14149.1 thioredoxin family protein [Trinickia caryophylli]WQE13969.1 thioredoxin family protein [Trinickia caryophylli]SMF83014.1 Peroxiredoxin [Trinickia caryophylli]GLU33551.1 thioredoxin family protein [Trinickia caryophylli]
MATESPADELGVAAPAFALPATDGRMYTLDDVRGRDGLVVVFMCNHCPYVKAILPHLLRDARELAALGVGTVAINSNDAATYPEDSFERMVALSTELQLPFPYLYDETQDVARAYGAVCTPEFYGFDATLHLRYRGRLDASRKGPIPDAPRELFDAMKQIASTGSGPEVQNPAFGCSIKWKMTA